MSDIAVIFLEVPVVGKPVKILYNGQEGYTEAVTLVQSHPTQPNRFRITTQAGVACEGSLSPTPPSTVRQPQPPSSRPAHARTPTKWTPKKKMIVAAVFVVLAIGGIIGSALDPESAQTGSPVPIGSVGQLDGKGETVEVPDGTKVQVIDIRLGVDILKKVRILEGEHYGMAGWLDSSYVRSLRSTNNE